MCEELGLAESQVKSLMSMGTAMGLLKPKSHCLTELGRLIAKHDIFFEQRCTLELCHLVASGAYGNLIWFELFNTPLHLMAFVAPADNEQENEYPVPHEDLEVRHLGELYENILEYSVQLADADRIKRRTKKGFEILLASQDTMQENFKYGIITGYYQQHKEILP